MGLLRSEAMKYGMLVLPVAQARKYVNAIGLEASLEFEDMNAHEMRRPYRKYVQRIDECERILRYLTEELGLLGCDIEKNHIEEFFEADANEAFKLDSVEEDLKKVYDMFVMLKKNSLVLKEEKNQALEERAVVDTAYKLLSALKTKEDDTLTTALLDPSERRVKVVSGVVSQADQYKFAGAVFRASRGNAHTTFTDMKDPIEDMKTGLFVDKTVFTIYFQGSANMQSFMKEKITKVCAAYGVSTYDWPETAADAKKRLTALEDTIADKSTLLSTLTSHMEVEAAELVESKNPEGNSKIEDYRLFCAKEKTIYHVLNLCEGDMLLRVKVWYAASEEAAIKATLEKTAGSNSKECAVLTPIPMSKARLPPTYIKVNDFTEPWQDLCNTYGAPRYQEANPALLSTVSFPFIFGMMYGDIGHGTMLLTAGILLIVFGEKLKYTVPVAYYARFLLFQLGIYAVFAGFMYTDLFSVGPELSFAIKSKWKRDPANPNGEWIPLYDITNAGPAYDGGLDRFPYPFGTDPAWIGASNALIFMNSLKMKLSVLMGVIQMTVGVFLRFANSIFFKSPTDFICECIPMLIFMLCFFGWMDFMIVYKWIYQLDDPPSVINSLICMAMGIMGSKDKSPLWTGSLPSTDLAQYLMLASALSVPWLLFPKPFILQAVANKEKKAKEAKKKSAVAVEGADAEALLHEEEEESGGHGGGHGHGEEFQFGEVMIHQIIETIEYVLGTVSHTASYLRIWALSLAHQQLSEVFFDKTIAMGLEMAGTSWIVGGIVIFLMFGTWLGITLGILIFMDTMECFLHTLRLHWVEFQQKFYKADGVSFAPYKIKTILLSSD